MKPSSRTLPSHTSLKTQSSPHQLHRCSSLPAIFFAGAKEGLPESFASHSSLSSGSPLLGLSSRRSLRLILCRCSSLPLISLLQQHFLSCALYRLGIPLKVVVQLIPEGGGGSRPTRKVFWSTRLEQISSFGGFDLVIKGSPWNNLAGGNKYKEFSS